MISLALQGKLSITEDPLTAAFADFIRYENRVDLLRAMFAKARPLAGTAALGFDFDSFELTLWPDLVGREPDIRVLLKAKGRLVARLIIEAKLGASKSGTGEIDSEARTGDQLGYYLKHESQLDTSSPTALLYLTHHGAMPRSEMRESADELVRIGRSDLAAGLFWLSWQEVHGVLAALPSPSMMAADLLDLLTKAEMVRFAGIDTRSDLPVLAASPFYAAQALRMAMVGGSYASPAVDLGPLGRWEYHGRRSGRAR